MFRATKLLLFINKESFEVIFVLQRLLYGRRHYSVLSVPLTYSNSTLLKVGQQVAVVS